MVLILLLNNLAANLLVQSREQIASFEKIQNQIELAFGLKRVMQLDNERMLNVHQNVALCLRPKSVFYLQNYQLTNPAGPLNGGLPSR